jgi:hypothetical protein
MAGSATDPSSATPSAPSGAGLRAQIIAEMSDSGPPAVDVAPKAEPAAQLDESKVEEADDAAPVETADSDEDTDAAEPDAEDDEDEAPADAETAKRLDVVRRAEKRMRAQMEAKEAELSAREQKYADKLARLDKIERLAARAKYDPAAVLREFGLTDEDMEGAGQAIYSESPAAKADPRRKEAAAKLLRERENADKLTAIEKRAAELEQKIERQQTEAKMRAEMQRYSDQISQTATTKHPLVAKLLDTDQDDTVAGLGASYERLKAKANGKQPQPSAVVAEYEKTIRAKFKRIGIDPEALLGSKPAANGEKPVKAANGKAVVEPKAGKPSRDELIAELSSLSD